MTQVLTLAQIGRYGFDHMDGWGWVPGVIGLVFMAAIVGLLAWFVVSMVRKPVATTSGGARALLDERYAKGEIDREDYLARKADLDK
jgi:putative membrane protein